MLRHHLITALRSLAYHRLYSIINIAGLSIGLAAAVLIVLYVRDELSYDDWIPGTANLYRLEATFHIPGTDPAPFAMASYPVVTAIRGQIPQVRAAIHVHPESMTVGLGDRQFRETVTFVDPDFFQVIRLPLADGDPARVLAEPESVVLSQSTARKLFGSLDPIGRTLTLAPDSHSSCDSNDAACLSMVYTVTVTGVVRDLPHNTQFVMDMVVPSNSRADSMPAFEKANDWTSLDGNFGYLELTPGADPAAVVSAVKSILDRSFDPRKLGVNLPMSEFEQYRLTPLRETHLTSDQFRGMTPGGSWTTVYGLSAIALLIVIIACCNFTNLATARATLRAREIAVRKLGGAKRWELIVQLLIEAVLFSVASLVIALALVEIALPPYSRFLGRPIALHYLADWPLLAALVAASMAVGVASGMYPAVVLSRFRPALSLRSRPDGFGSPGMLRAALVIVQFAISIGLGIIALVVVRQVEFARQVDLGFDRDGVVIVRGIGGLTPSTRDSLASALRANPQIAAVSYSNAVPFELSYVDNDQIRTSGGPVAVAAQVINIDPEFASLYGMKVLAGRFLSEQRGEDLTTRRATVRNMLINATGARRLGFSPEQAVGQSVSVGGRYTGRIVGVLNDTKLQGMRSPVPPELFYFDQADAHAMRLMSLRIRGELAPQTLSFIDRTWRSFVSGAAIDRYYLSEAFDTLFQPDQKQGQILGLFVGIAMVIACLGVIGLAVFTAERRTKEIGVRKIAGARTQAIVSLMLWRISVPVLIANLIAWPLAYSYLNRWLEGYAYRISLSPAYFLAGGAVALLAAWTAVFAHTLRLARTSPIHALRYE